MPSHRLTDQPSSIFPYDVLAQSAGTSNLMTHASLCNELEPRNDVTSSTKLTTFEMMPPLRHRHHSCDAAGKAELSEKEQQKIRTFLHNREGEKKAHRQRLKLMSSNVLRSQYRIHPASTRPTRQYPCWRFSCIGFVLSAYLYAGIRLLKEPFPLKSLNDLKELYPDFEDDLDDPQTCVELGIGEGDSWPIALVGYVLHSLNRTAEEIRDSEAGPYIPTEGDEYFPRNTSTIEIETE